MPAVDRQRTKESWSQPGDPAALAREFAAERLSRRSSPSEEKTTFRWGLYDRKPLQTGREDV
jgi:hypothetical protein